MLGLHKDIREWGSKVLHCAKKGDLKRIKIPNNKTNYLKTNDMFTAVARA